MRHGQSAGQENRAGERNVPAGAEVGRDCKSTESAGGHCPEMEVYS